MLTNETVSKLQEMHVKTMAQEFKTQMENPRFNELSFEDRFGMIVDAEWTHRKNNRLRSLIQNAGFSCPSASVEDIEYLPERNLDKAFILRLASCSFISDARI